MKGLYKNKYRIASARHPDWDYGSDNAYFVTICTQNRSHFFGEINNGMMQLSPIGEYAMDCWHEIPKHFPFVKLGAFVVMPNHIHGIVIINKNGQPPSHFGNNKFGPQSMNLASIIRGYKIGVTKLAKKTNSNWQWQARYHDHIIRNPESFKRITNYILNNPANWIEDRFYNR